MIDQAPLKKIFNARIGYCGMEECYEVKYADIPGLEDLSSEDQDDLLDRISYQANKAFSQMIKEFPNDFTREDINNAELVVKGPCGTELSRTTLRYQR